MDDIDGGEIANDPAYLARLLQEAARNEGCTLGDITVLNLLTDPYRCATPNNLRDGAWVADKLATTSVRHIRGLHYAILGMTKPDGFAYTNTQDDYEWLSIAVTQARWQGVIPFEALGDNRADPPTIYRKGELPKFRTISHGPIGLDTLHNMLPTAIGSIPGKQRYLLAIFGEKSSLGSELRPVADQYGARPFIIAAKSGRLEMAKFLLERGAAITARNNRGLTALHEAADRGQAEMVDWLLSRSMEINSRDDIQYTPLHFAANGVFTNESHYVAVAKVLLAHGADVNARTRDNQTPLHRAAAWGRPAVIQVLLRAKPDLDACDNDGKTALDLAIAGKRNDCVEILRKAMDETKRVKDP